MQKMDRRRLSQKLEETLYHSEAKNDDDFDSSTCIETILIVLYIEKSSILRVCHCVQASIDFRYFKLIQDRY